MPNFGRVFCFIKFNVNLSKLQEIFCTRMRMKEIAGIHNSKRLQRKAKNPSHPCIFLFIIFHKSGHFLLSLLEKIIASQRELRSYS